MRRAGPPASLPPASIGLSMIVRNEQAVIERCLDSVKGIISHWVIVDTGSTDGTQDVVRRCLGDLPGRLVERPWVDFGHNRTEALALAAGTADYLLVIDADEVLEFEPGFRWPDLSADAYAIETRLRGLSYRRTQLVRNSGDWRYRGVVHECITSPRRKAIVPLPGVVNRPHQDGARSADPHKFRRDALALEAALLDEPDNLRYRLYLANSYRDARDYEAALTHYRRRAALGGADDEEAWYAAYQAGLMLALLDRPWEQAHHALLEAWARRPQRAEPLFHLAVHYRSLEQYPLAGLYAQRAAAIAAPDDALFVELDVYGWRLAFECAICAYWDGRHAEAVRLNNRVLTHPDATPDVYAQALRNRRWSLEALHRPAAPAAPLPPRRFHVLVPFRNPGSAFDNCIATLLRQAGPAVSMTFVDLGSDDGSRRQVPLEDPRVALEGPAGLAEARHRVIVERCRPDDVVVQLDGADWLAHDAALATLQALYDAHRCELLVAQYRDSDGTHGRNLPLPDEAALRQLTRAEVPALACTYRAGLYQRLAGGPIDDPELTLRLLRQAGWAGTRFTDEVLVVRNTDDAP